MGVGTEGELVNASRRGFLGALLGAAAAAAKDPEELIFRPGAKLISIPGPKVLTLDEARDIYLKPAFEQLTRNIDRQEAIWAMRQTNHAYDVAFSHFAASTAPYRPRRIYTVIPSPHD